MQTPIGDAADKYGSRRVLICGLLLGGMGYVNFGLHPTYPHMLLTAVTFGIANGVYHPSDYSILGSVIEPSRLGRAFAWHTFSGYLGGALQPYRGRHGDATRKAQPAATWRACRRRRSRAGRRGKAARSV